MPDYSEVKNYINYNTSNNDKIYYPSTYDDYRKIILPYNFQNINFNELKKNYEIGVKNLRTAIFSNGNKQNNLTWLKVTNDEEIDKNKLYKSTFHYDVIQKYGELINQYFGKGSNVDLLSEKQLSRNDQIKCTLMWNYIYGKLFLIWYVLTDKDGNNLIDENDITKTSDDIALEYLKELSGENNNLNNYYNLIINSGSSYLQKDFCGYDSSKGLGIILRATSEIGLEYEDLKSYYIRYIFQGGNSDYPRTRRLELLETLVNNENNNNEGTWAGELQASRKYYFKSIEKIKNEKKENEHIIINENKAIFNSTKYTTFTFNITNTNFTDYGVPIDSNIHFWEADKEYQVGDLVIGITPRKNQQQTKLLDECGFGYIYKCVRKHSSKYFKKTEKKKVKEEINSTTNEKVITYQTIKNWLLVDTNFIKEIRAFSRRVYGLTDDVLKDYLNLQGYNYEDIRKGNWREQIGSTKEEDKLVLVRFVLPALTTENEIALEDGKLVNKQVGNIIWETNLPSNIVLLNEDELTLDNINDPEKKLKYSVYLREIIGVKDKKSHFYNLTKDEINEDDIEIIFQPEEKDKAEDQSEEELTIESRMDKASEADSEITYIHERGTPCILNKNIININTRAIRYFLIPLKYLHEGFFINIKFDSSLHQINKNVFANRMDLVKIVFNSYMNIIDDKAFSNCQNLKEVILSKNLTYLGEQAFSGCKSLTQVTLPKNIKSLKGTYIGCTNLKSVVLNNCKKIGNYTFMNCINLENVYGTDKIEEIGVSAFNNCPKLRRFNINKKVTSISDKAFKNCQNCEFKFLPRITDELVELENIQFLGEYSFESCYKLKKAFPITNNCILSKGVYKNCKNLISASLPENLTDFTIPEELFYGCFNLKELKNFEDNNTIRVLSNKCFQGCGFLEEITLPFENVDALLTTEKPQYYIGENVFWNCFNLRIVNVKDNSVLDLIENSINKNNWIDATFTIIKKMEVNNG